MNGAISNSDNVINTKKLLARIHWLEQALNYRCSDEYSDELKMLRALAEHIESVASPTAYEEGSDLVRDSYLQQYMSSAESTNPESVSRLAFSPINFDGEIYWLRGTS
jgi:hypothetical protein